MNNFISPKTPKEKGITLVLALLLTGTVTIAALIIAALLVRELHLTDNIRKSLIAYYGAESGLESALYDYKNGDWPPPNIHGDVAEVSSWDINFGLGATEMNVSLPWETTKEIPLYDAEGSFGVTAIKFCWSNCGAGGPHQLGLGPAAIEWTILTLHQNVGETETWMEPGPRGAEISRGIIDGTGKTEVLLNLPWVIENWDATDRHVLRFKHINGENHDAVDFQITMQGAGGGAVPFNQETSFKVTGTAAGGEVSRALEVTLLPRSPAYNVFDYVIFSDTYVGKEDTQAGSGPVGLPGGVVGP